MYRTRRYKGGHGRPCPYCGKEMRQDGGMGPGVFCARGDAYPTRDHFYPVSRFVGANARKNIVVVCRQCNQDKADHSPQEWAEVLYKSGDTKRFRRVLALIRTVPPRQQIDGTERESGGIRITATGRGALAATDISGRR